MFNTNPAVDVVYGEDLRSESQFDQDFILLDFVEELLGWSLQLGELLRCKGALT